MNTLNISIWFTIWIVFIELVIHNFTYSQWISIVHNRETNLVTEETLYTLKSDPKLNLHGLKFIYWGKKSDGNSKVHTKTDHFGIDLFATPNILDQTFRTKRKHTICQ
jgi:hypothetical protein